MDAEHRGSPSPIRRWRLVVAPIAVVVLAVGVAMAVTRDEESVAPSVTTTTTTAPPSTTTTSAPTPTTTSTVVIPPEPIPPASTGTAVLRRAVPSYDGPGGAATGTVDGLYYGWSIALPVVDQAPDGWLRVRTPYRPNGSTAWIRAADVEFGSTPWAIQIDVTTMRLRLYHTGRLVLDAPVGVGTDATPTALGDFFVTFLQGAPSAAYGPFVMVTSGHSEVIQNFGGFPDGIFGIHGPIGPESWIGDTGARISNGCIRMRLADQAKLADVTSGSPVHVYAS